MNISAPWLVDFISGSFSQREGVLGRCAPLLVSSTENATDAYIQKSTRCPAVIGKELQARPSFRPTKSWPDYIKGLGRSNPNFNEALAHKLANSHQLWSNATCLSNNSHRKLKEPISCLRSWIVWKCRFHWKLLPKISLLRLGQLTTLVNCPLSSKAVFHSSPTQTPCLLNSVI